MRDKHPPAQPCSADSIVSPELDPPATHPIIYEAIVDTRCIKSAALHTFGAGGPSGVDALCWRRYALPSREPPMICAFLSRWLLESSVLTSLTLSIFVPGLSSFSLNKNPGVRPIGTCETVRRITTKVCSVHHSTRHT